MSCPFSSEEHAGDFLGENLVFSREANKNRPHVTLTFAQSQDGKIAGAHKTQLALSGSESMLMTHKLRTLHDGIMVGIGTVLNDNPQLNARLLSSPPAVSDLPRPIVLDSNLRTPVDCKLIKNHIAGVGRQPLILSSNLASVERRSLLEKIGAQVIQIEHGSSTGLLNWSMLLKHLYDAGVRRLMVEGGAAVIDGLMQQPHFIDALLVTIAPVTVGSEGLGFSSALPNVEATTAATHWKTSYRAMFGKDQVILWHRR
ncbi:related to RIB7 - HTP reductase [Melanopsichium pennsylvanicum]|uniref:2,5-diamino-6-ribosylamino-4(3H)-pyrimidinone 5'-phosphate reductase n=2 Tax=Melanopsichium pennsylvanicum TaxID=63383 RepID=A0AAJ4XTH6_9BASI|nr:related to RIB7-HTP reductase [Melanopsichium pennsylvanicum 4]SNX87851.1 related to RIB7 - HTP reductase [Melanopsichium pennsylvanicum]